MNVVIEDAPQRSARMVAEDPSYRSAIIIMASEEGHHVKVFGDPFDYYAALSGLKDEAKKLMQGQFAIFEQEDDD